MSLPACTGTGTVCSGGQSRAEQVEQRAVVEKGRRGCEQDGKTEWGVGGSMGAGETGCRRRQQESAF